MGRSARGSASTPLAPTGTWSAKTNRDKLPAGTIVQVTPSWLDAAEHALATLVLPQGDRIYALAFWLFNEAGVPTLGVGTEMSWRERAWEGASETPFGSLRWSPAEWQHSVIEVGPMAAPGMENLVAICRELTRRARAREGVFATIPLTDEFVAAVCDPRESIEWFEACVDEPLRSRLFTREAVRVPMRTAEPLAPIVSGRAAVVYRLEPAYGRARVLLLDLDDAVRLRRSTPRVVRAQWSGPPDLPPSDLACGWPPVFSRLVVERFGDWLRTAGRFVPVDVEGETGSHCLFVVDTVADCLDTRRSSKPGRNGKLAIVVFDRQKLPSAPAFRIPQNTGFVFWTRDFVEALVRESYRGVATRTVWSDDPSITAAAKPMR